MRSMQHVIRFAVWVLAVLMVLVIVAGVFEVIVQLYRRITDAFTTPLDISETFGSFMTVLIAIEIFENIVVYLRSSEIRLRIVMATALLAVARKIIILDVAKTGALYFFGGAAALAATAAAYWIVSERGAPQSPAAIGAGES